MKVLTSARLHLWEKLLRAKKKKTTLKESLWCFRFQAVPPSRLPGEQPRLWGDKIRGVTPGRHEASKYAALSQQLARREENFQASVSKINSWMQTVYSQEKRLPEPPRDRHVI